LGFEWDPRKEARNVQKHGIAFEDAAKIFAGAHFERPDEHDHNGEQRWIAAEELGGRVLVVVYAWRGDSRRIISARKATKAEREGHYRSIYGE
jgi:uncharacterized DUF497 family protein